MLQTINGKVELVVVVAYAEIVEEYRLENALEALQKRGLRGCTVPEVLDMRLACPSLKKDQLWQKWFSTTSGIYNVGNQVIVTHGVKHPLADPQRIRSALEEGLVNYGARLTDEEVAMFREGRVDGLRTYEDFVCETTGKNITEPFAVRADVELFKGLPKGFSPLAEWQDDPRTILLAGGRKRVMQYAERLSQEKVRESWISLDVEEGLADRGCVALVGSKYGLNGSGNFILNYNGRFVAVVPNAQ